MERITARRIDDSTGYPAVVVQCGQYDYYFRPGQDGTASCYRMTDANGSRDKTIPSPSIEVRRLAAKKLEEAAGQVDLFSQRAIKSSGDETPQVIWCNGTTVEIKHHGTTYRLRQDRLGRSDLPSEVASLAMAVLNRIRRSRNKRAEIARILAERQVELFPTTGVEKTR